MRKGLLTLSLLCIAMGAAAQPEAGSFSLTPKLGVAMANLTHNSFDTKDFQTIKSKYRAGITAGVEGSYMVTDYLGLSLGAFYSTLGSHYKDFSEKLSATETTEEYQGYSDYYTLLGYIQMPLLVRYYVYDGLAVKVGLQPAYLAHAKTSYDTRSFSKDVSTGEFTYGEQTSEKITGTDGYKRFDFSIPVGLSYENMNVMLDFQYNIPLTKVKDDLDSKNNAFLFTVGYKFTL